MKQFIYAVKWNGQKFSIFIINQSTEFFFFSFTPWFLSRTFQKKILYLFSNCYYYYHYFAVAWNMQLTKVFFFFFLLPIWWFFSLDFIRNSTQKEKMIILKLSLTKIRNFTNFQGNCSVFMQKNCASKIGQPQEKFIIGLLITNFTKRITYLCKMIEVLKKYHKKKFIIQ